MRSCKNCGHEITIHNGIGGQCVGNPKRINFEEIRVCGCRNPEPKEVEK